MLGLKKYVYLPTILGCLFFLIIHTENLASQEAAHDTIIRFDGRRKVVDVITVSATDVSYKCPGSKRIEHLSRNYIERIIYRSGKVEIFNKPVVQVIEENRWEAVLVTEKKEDVEGMYEYGLVKAISSSDVRNMKAAKKSATIRLQKKAANMGANVVLVIKTIAVGGYGEIPGYNIEGIAYGFKPPVKKQSEEEKESRKE